MSDRLAYGAGAVVYDLLAGEAVYRVGRLAGVRMLDLRPGDTVLDVGCGTGLNFAHLERAVGGSGRIIGLDRSVMQVPTGPARILAPLARLACAIGGADIEAHPWDLLAADADPDDVQQRSLRGGHIQVVAGTIP